MQHALVKHTSEQLVLVCARVSDMCMPVAGCYCTPGRAQRAIALVAGCVGKSACRGADNAACTG
jgi:hypothetical protein